MDPPFLEPTLRPLNTYTGGSALSFGDYALGITPTPEPSTYAMLFGGFADVLGYLVRRNKAGCR